MKGYKVNASVSIREFDCYNNYSDSGKNNENC